MLQDINKYDILVPKVYSFSETYLLLEFIKEKSLGKEAEELAAAKVLTDLHSVTNES